MVRTHPALKIHIGKQRPRPLIRTPHPKLPINADQKDESCQNPADQRAFPHPARLTRWNGHIRRLAAPVKRRQAWDLEDEHEGRKPEDEGFHGDEGDYIEGSEDEHCPRGFGPKAHVVGAPA